MSTASDIAALKAAVAALNGQIAALQQRISRDEAAIKTLQADLSRVRKG